MCIRDRSQAEERGRYKGGERLIEASYIAGRSQSTSTAHQTAKPVNRKERTLLNEKLRQAEENVLTKWATEASCW